MTTIQEDLLKWLHINVIAVIQMLNCLWMIWSEREETFKIWDLWDSDLQFHSSLQCLFPSLAHEIWMWWWQHLGWLDDYTLAWWWWQMTTSNRKLQLFQNKNNPATHFLKVRYTCTLHSGIRNKVSILPQGRGGWSHIQCSCFHR